MKRMIYMIGITLLFVACGKDVDTPVIPPSGKMSITFDNVRTRAPLHTVSNTFALYGTATVADAASVVFNNQRVDYILASGIWEYSPLRYWDPQADYKFAAYAPYDASLNLSINNEGYPAVTNFVVRQNVAEQESLLLSNTVERNVEASGLDMSAVVFTFNPVLTRVNFRIRKDPGVIGTLSLNALRMYNLKSSGNCVSSGTGIVWDTSSAPINAFGYSTSFASAQEISLEGIQTWQGGALMVPQQISGVSIYLSYTHRPNDVTYLYDKDNITLPGTDWEPGKQITYVLTLKPENTVEIGEPIVEPWIESSTGGGVIIVS